MPKPRNQIQKVIKVGPIPEYCLGVDTGRPKGLPVKSQYKNLLEQLETCSMSGMAVLVAHAENDRERMTQIQKLRAFLAARGYTLRTRGDGPDMTWLWLEPQVPSSSMGKGWLCGRMGIVREACPYSPGDIAYDHWMNGWMYGSREAFKECGE